MNVNLSISLELSQQLSSSQPEAEPAMMVIILVINFSFTLSLTADLSYRSDTAHQNDVNERNDDDCPAVIGNFGQLTPAGASLQPGYGSRQAACSTEYTIVWSADDVVLAFATPSHQEYTAAAVAAVARSGCAMLRLVCPPALSKRRDARPFTH